MMSLEIFVFALLIVSTITALVTEAVKKVLTEYNVAYRANTLAGIVAIALAVLISIGFIIVSGELVSLVTIVNIVALAIMSWLCAMIGYDKVIQAISQFKTYRKDE